MPDRKKAVEILIVIIGGAYLLYRIYVLMIGAKDASPGSDGAPEYMPGSPDITTLKKSADKAAEEGWKLKYDTGDTRNIFQKPDEFFTSDTKTASDAALKTQSIALSLEGVMWGRGKNVAILSGKVVAEGDIIDGGKVIGIEPGKVIISKNGVISEIKRGA